jgi:hypothetical protein
MCLDKPGEFVTNPDNGTIFWRTKEAAEEYQWTKLDALQSMNVIPMEAEYHYMDLRKNKS